MPLRTLTPLLALPLVGCFGASALSQGTGAAAPAGAAAAAPSEAASAPVQRVEVSAQRDNDTEQRRRSTAAKIVVGRDEIEKYGDASLGELLKRLPGVTVQGQGGRGGQIRMRGLGNGYTQILLDGERVQGGLSLDSLTPDQVERIEIIRAPTAETSARAIGGTLNIITREGYVKRLNDLRLSLSSGERGRLSSHAAWSRNGQLESLDYTVAVSAFEGHAFDDSDVTTVGSDGARRQTSLGPAWHQGADVNAKLQWRLEGGGSLMLMPVVFHARNASQRDWLNTALAPTRPADLDWLSAHSRTEGAHTMARLNGLWRTPLAAGRLEVRGGLGRYQSHSHTVRDEDGVTAASDDEVHSRDHSLHLNSKYSLLLDNGHSVVGGVELDLAERRERRDAFEAGVAVDGDFGENLDARSRRLAAYLQDEWTVTPQWAAHAGLRWEGIRTEGGVVGAGDARNQSSVWTPLLHAVWKPEPRSRDQVRVSLTRSYRSPGLSDLVGATWRSKGGNSPTNPDRSGNSALQPELAAGIDLAFEHYPAGGGLFSVNLFQRRIEQLMRTLTTLEPQADGSARWVARPTNIGRALTQGVELEARGRLTDWWAEAPAVDLRANASLFRSRVDGVNGPDNRLDQQPDGTANLGADYKLPGWPLTVGGSLNWTPGYATRLSDTQWLQRDMKRVVDAHVLWQVQPDVRLRLSGSNLAPQDGLTVARVVSGGFDETTRSTSTGHPTWRLQLELKL